MTQFVAEQLSLSTAEEEANYFTGNEQEAQILPDPNAVLPPGTYRVIEGHLYRIVRGVPGSLPVTAVESPQRKD